jgi:hypothetical protein
MQYRPAVARLGDVQPKGFRAAIGHDHDEEACGEWKATAAPATDDRPKGG